MSVLAFGLGWVWVLRLYHTHSHADILCLCGHDSARDLGHLKRVALMRADEHGRLKAKNFLEPWSKVNVCGQQHQPRCFARDCMDRSMHDASINLRTSYTRTIIPIHHMLHPVSIHHPYHLPTPTHPYTDVPIDAYTHNLHGNGQS